MTKTKQQLLQELATYVHLDSGRKIRTDKNKTHSNFVQTKLAIYNRLKNKLSNRKAREENLLLEFEFDENGFYLPIPEEYTTKAIDYKQTVKDNRIINHSTRRIRTQLGIDLEEYRFNAWQEIAMNRPYEIVPPNQDLNGILFVRYGIPPEEAEHLTLKRRPIWLEIFSETYHIKPLEVPRWSYKEWSKYYSYVPTQFLDDDFVFEYGKLPGTAEFHPEWAYKKQEVETRTAEERQQEEQRKAQQFITNLNKKS